MTLTLKAELPITAEEIETARQPAELLDWCVSKIGEIAAVNGGTHAVRFGEGLCKVLTDEVYPLGRWGTVEGFVAPDAWLTPKVGSEPYDALVESVGAEPSQYFAEVTQAHMGQSEHFRMVNLEQKRWAPGPLSGLEREGGRGAPEIPSSSTAAISD